MTNFDFDAWLDEHYAGFHELRRDTAREFRELIEAADHSVSGMETLEECDCHSCRLIRALCNLGVRS